MPKIRQEPVLGEDGFEHHPAFGMAHIGRIHATPGEPLFQSDLQHREYIQLTITEADRKRELKDDWVHPGRTVAQVNMSLAQFASLVTSAGTEGVPVTIDWTAKDGDVPGLFPGSRLHQTATEVLGAADEAYSEIRDALAAYKQGLEGKVPAAERRRLMGALDTAVRNATPNVAYAGKKLAEHAEAVVEKSRADVEAMVRMAQSRGEAVQVENPVQGALEA